MGFSVFERRFQLSSTGSLQIKCNGYSSRGLLGNTIHTKRGVNEGPEDGFRSSSARNVLSHSDPGYRSDRFSPRLLLKGNLRHTGDAKKIPINTRTIPCIMSLTQETSSTCTLCEWTNMNSMIGRDDRWSGDIVFLHRTP